MQEDLRRRESELTEAQRIAGIGNWTWDPKTDAVTWSDELRNMVRWDAMLPVPSFSDEKQFFDADSWRRLNEAVQKALTSGEPYEVDCEGTRADGGKVWFTQCQRTRRGQRHTAMAR